MSRSKNNYSNNGYKKKRAAKKWLSIICAFLAGALVIGAYSALTAEKDLNPNNLIKVEQYYDNLLEESSKGLKIDWKNDGRIVLSGKHSDDDLSNNAHFYVPFTIVTLDPGTYRLSANNDNCDDETYGLYYVLNSTNKEVYSDGAVITLNTATTIEIGFFVKNNYRIVYGELQPVLVTDGNSTSFYVED